MPPVADKPETTPWGIAMKAALDANAAAGREPSNWYSLGTALSEHPDSRANAESWRTEIKRIRKRPPNEARAVMVAEALGVDRSSLPESRPSQSLAELADELADAMRHIAMLERRVESLEAQRSPLAASPTASQV